MVKGIRAERHRTNEATQSRAGILDADDRHWVPRDKSDKSDQSSIRVARGSVGHAMLYRRG
jgi:hypothetical protein